MNETTATDESHLEWLIDLQASRCAYGTREGDGRTCDCKFGLVYAGDLLGGSEVTGCAELRKAIWAVRAVTGQVNR